MANGAREIKPLLFAVYCQFLRAGGAAQEYADLAAAQGKVFENGVAGVGVLPRRVFAPRLRAEICAVLDGWKVSAA